MSGESRGNSDPSAEVLSGSPSPAGAIESSPSGNLHDTGQPEASSGDCQPRSGSLTGEETLPERQAALCLHLVRGIGPLIFERLVQRFGSASKVLQAAPSDLRQVTGVSQQLAHEIATQDNRQALQEQLKLCSQHQIEVLDLTDERYPAPLKEIYDPPAVLFMQGELLPQDSLAIAIVGSRHATHYGLRTAERLAAELALRGFTIISGLARGIDAAAHRGALKVGGRTVAVLGGGILNLYPPEHQPLAREITGAGAVLSESLPLSAPKSGAFPRRNRIVSGLALGVLVVEASGQSGALITARLATEQGREVFAVPGPIDSRMSRGCHRLLKDGAALVETADDILEELGPLAVPARLSSETTVRNPAELKLGEQERRVLDAISTSETSFDELVAITQLPAPRILSTISILEVRGLIKRLSGTRFVRN
jgi:DNA processing protein